MAGPENLAGRVPEAIERFFQSALFTMVLSGFIMLASTGKLDPVSMVIILVAIIARGRLLYLRREIRLSDEITNWLTLGYVVFYAVDFLFISGSYLTATVHLLLFVMGVKLFSVSRERDYVYLAALSFGMVLSAAVLTVDSVFLFGFAVFLVLATATFIAMEMRRSAREGSALVRGTGLAFSRVTRSIGSISFGLVLGMLVFGAGFFFMLPRLSGGYLSRFAPRSALVTGFSNDVQLGKIGEIQQSSEIVMHIKIEGDTTGTHSAVKWRGVALNTFDGKEWRSHLGRSMEASVSGRYDLGEWRAELKKQSADLGNPTVGWTRMGYRVLMEPIGTDVFFLAPVPYTLTTNFRSLQMDSAGAMYGDGSHMITAYDAISNVREPSIALLRESPPDYPATIAISDLQLPNVDPRVRELAARVTASSGNEYDRAAAVERYLKMQFQYTLQLPTQLPKDPIAHFLFERRAGHCEYFASSMAVMLRTLGIPSRVVNGFRTGEFNDVTGTYIVRGQDAHSWVEVYFANAGWVSFDPTPGVADPLGSQNSRWHRVGLYVDALGEFWREWVVNYDYQHQMDLSFHTMLKAQAANRRGFDWWKHKYADLLNRLRDYAKHPAPTRRSAATVAAALALLLVLANLRRGVQRVRERRLLRKPGEAPVQASSLLYERLLERLARRGHHKRPQQTPKEFAQQIANAHLRQNVQRFTEHYEHARYGASAAAAEALPELFEEVIAE